MGLLHAAGSRRSRETAPCGRFARPGRWSSSTPRALVGRPISGLSSVLSGVRYSGFIKVCAVVIDYAAGAVLYRPGAYSHTEEAEDGTVQHM